MIRQALRPTVAEDQFARLHRLFLEHFGIATGLAWMAAAVAAMQVPWIRNIRGLIDPTGRVESTASFLFGIPLILTLAWIGLAFGGGLIRRATVMRRCETEFAVAGAVAFGVFCMAIHRVVVALSLAG